MTLKTKLPTRRSFMRNGSALLASGMALSNIPAWARTAADGNMGKDHLHGLNISSLSGSNFDLTVDQFPMRINGRAAMVTGVNGSVPAPLLRFREGDDITINVKNNLKEDTSIHWHGLLVPFEMDGVPGVTFPGIKAGETFQYKFNVPQNGTYWYHSHSGLQEQLGHYGPLIIDPAGHDPVEYDREYVLVLSDWSFEDPYRIFAKLKKSSETYNYNHRTLQDFAKDAGEDGVMQAFKERAMWGGMRMSPRDIADVTGATYHYLINGHTTKDNWHGIFRKGEKIRLRIINAAAMSMFNIRIPGLPMTIVQADGLHTRPHEIDEFQIGVAETYDVIVEPKEDKVYGFVAESIDRSGQVVASFGPKPNAKASEPKLRPVPTLTMKDMGHDMEGMSHGEMDHSSMGHGSHGNHDMMGHQPKLKTGPGVANVAMMPQSRLHEAGIGLENVPHRTLKYADLRSLTPNTDQRVPAREIDLHLTSNMERYMWSFDGVKFSDVTAPIRMYKGERVRMHMTNNTMMPHPIHLHGMFFELVIPDYNGDHRPYKHTVIVKPGEKLSIDISAEHIGDWAFHCHLIYHMHAGMMQVVSVLPKGEMKPKGDHAHHQHHQHKKSHDDQKKKASSHNHH